jgi:hypothetical protein
MAVEKKIIKLAKPTIALDQMDHINTDDPNSPVQSTERKHKQMGSLFPLVQINKYKFTENELTRFRLDETGEYPTLSVTVVSSDGVFLSKSYPKDGDPISIFVRSKLDEFNPIRLDFEITNVQSGKSTDSDGEVAKYTFNGVLRVPGLYYDHCRAFKDKGSMDVLMDVATELQLGFASNETMTDDKMTWICPFDTYLKFINDVTLASYKDEDSFFDFFIDKYYNLNFVNVNNQFGEEFELDEALDNFQAQRDYNAGHVLEKFDTKLLLSNHKNLRGQGNWISNYTLVSNAGEVIITNGYRRYVQFYDAHGSASNPADKYQSHFIEPSNTKNVGDDKILQRGRMKEPEIYKNTNKYKWLGIHESLPDGNAHKNYMHAIIQNWQNRQEIDKYELRVWLPRCNFNLYRGMRVPVLILNTGSQSRLQVTKQPEQAEEERLTFDRFLSGYYYIKGMTVSWNADDTVFRQELILTRREWPIPPQTSENIAQG